MLHRRGWFSDRLLRDRGHGGDRDDHDRSHNLRDDRDGHDRRRIRRGDRDAHDHSCSLCDGDCGSDRGGGW